MWFIPAFPVIYIKALNCPTDKLISVHISMFSRVSMHELLTSAIAEFHIIQTSYCREHVAHSKKLDLILSDRLGQ